MALYRIIGSHGFQKLKAVQVVAATGGVVGIRAGTIRKSSCPTRSPFFLVARRQ